MLKHDAYAQAAPQTTQTMLQTGDALPSSPPPLYCLSLQPKAAWVNHELLKSC